MLQEIQLGRRTITITDHARDRYYERRGVIGTGDLARDLVSAQWDRAKPSWLQLSMWHRARAEGYVVLDDERCFVVNRNPSGDLVAVTYMDRLPVPSG